MRASDADRNQVGTYGDDGDYRAGAGWDACTGLGSADGAKVPAAVRS
jgi:kumamolisin